MFDIGWQELFIIGLVTIIVVGPKELPRVLRAATLWIRKIKGMARDFQDGLEDLAREADLEDMKKELENSASFDLDGELERSIDPSGEIGASVRELENAVDEPAGASPAAKEDPRPDGDDTSAKKPKPAPAKAGDKA